jgi:epothilone synthetase B
MAEFVNWRREDGEPFDPWLRVHWRCGAEIIKIAPASLEIKAGLEEWERWTGLHFPTSGEYTVPGALAPVHIDRQAGIGTYVEPNVWMHHPIRTPYLTHNRATKRPTRAGSLADAQPVDHRRSEPRASSPNTTASRSLHDPSLASAPGCLHELLAGMAEQCPEAVAVVYQGESLTYHALNRRANQVAWQLQQLAVRPETLIGLSLQPSVEMVIALLGVLKAGGAFVPLDPAYPPERLRFMVADARMPLVVTTRACAGNLPQGQAELVYLEDLAEDGDDIADPTSAVQPHHLACCLYTSGSTGQPKGVMIEHQALVNHCASVQAIYRYTPADRVLLFASLNYVAALEQLFAPLLAGATVVLREPALWSAIEFPAKVKEYGLTVVDLPPGYWHSLLASWVQTPALVGNLPLRMVILGGDVTTPELVHLWHQTPLGAVRFLNAYGMTETPVTATLFEIPPDPERRWERVPIGRPTPNRTAYVLDGRLQPQPVGVAGELHIGGASLARGYLHQPALTAARFIRDPFCQDANARLYKTGDLARTLPDGTLEYLGRLDRQIQIRGFRVELGEIEAALQQHPAVKEAAVVAPGEALAKRLVAYVVRKAEETTAPLQVFWQPDSLYRDEAGVLTDPLERLAFKLKQANLCPVAAPSIPLQKPAVDGDFLQRYLSRQSYRRFANRPITFAQFSRFLSALVQANLPDTPLPKYRYPSALGLYPVQTYLYLKPGQVEGVAAGFYYYHPVTHGLQLLQAGGQLPSEAYTDSEQPILAQAGFALFLIAHLDAITPLYGQTLARTFCLLEAGYIGQLLMAEAPEHHIGLCPVATMREFETVREQLGLTDTQILLHSFLGGAIEPAHTRQWLQPSPAQMAPSQLTTELHTSLRRKLPAHMVPETVVWLETMPLTPNGKIDRQALLSRPVEETENRVNYAAPRTPIEAMLARLWAEVLHLERVGAEDDFFVLGGNSLTALRLLHKLQQAFRVDLPLRTLLQCRTIGRLAAQIEALQTASSPAPSDATLTYEEGVL